MQLSDFYRWTIVDMLTYLEIVAELGEIGDVLDVAHVLTEYVGNADWLEGVV